MAATLFLSECRRMKDKVTRFFKCNNWANFQTTLKTTSYEEKRLPSTENNRETVSRSVAIPSVLPRLRECIALGYKQLSAAQRLAKGRARKTRNCEH